MEEAFNFQSIFPLTFQVVLTKSQIISNHHGHDFLRTKIIPPNFTRKWFETFHVFAPTPRCEAHQHGTKTSVDPRCCYVETWGFLGMGENVKRDPNSLQRLERWPTPMVRGFFFQVTAASIRLDNFCVHQLKIYERLVFETTKQKKLSYLRKRAKFHLHSTLEGF